MNRNTLKTIFGYLTTLLQRITPARFRKSNLESVFNYLQISPTLATSGQPTRDQFASIRQAGYTTVINLLPHGHENGLPGEAALMQELGMDYIHIPVDFKAPNEDEFLSFCEAMRALEGQKTWVHCAANMRVSAFLYRYHVEQLGMDADAARQQMEKIWTPFGVWKDFLKSGGPNT